MSSREIIFAAAGASTPTYVEDVFSTWLYTGNGATQTITNGIQLGDASIVTPENSTALPSISNFRTNSVAFGNGLYVAIGEIVTGGDRRTTSYATSPDGITWTARSSLPNAIWQSIVFANGRFVAVSRFQDGWSNSSVATSTDGLSWNSSTTGFATNYDTRNISFANGEYLIVGSTIGTGYRSSNGTTWTTFTLFGDGESTFTWNGIAFGNSRYVLLGQGSTYSSTNLSSWTGPSAVSLSTAHGIAFGAGRFLAVGSAGYAVSTDGVNFTNYTNITSASGNGSVAFTGTRFVWATTGTPARVNVSTDAINWTSYTITPPAGDLTVAARSEGAVVVTATQNGRYVGNISSFTPSVLGKGGMVWIKSRSAATNNFLFDTTRGALNEVNSNTTDAQASLANSLTAFNSNGFSLGSAAGINVNAATYVSWTFEEMPRFFDIVTYTGNGSSNRQISHNLGSVPGMMIVKNLSTPQNWRVYHRSLTSANNYLDLNTTAAQASATSVWAGTAPTSSVFSVGNEPSVNESGSQFVAYLFAHDAGGFGAAGTDNIISCGTFSSTGSNVSINLGYEPQYILIKSSNATGAWRVVDVMRGMSQTNGLVLVPNTSAAETDFGQYLVPTATGFDAIGLATASYIYMAIRRPMKTPTTGTSVFSPVTYTGNSGTQAVTAGFSVDFALHANPDRNRNGANFAFSRLQGSVYLTTNTTNAEISNTEFSFTSSNANTGVTTSGIFNTSPHPYINWNFRRAPGFFDVVCYTGTGSAITIPHNLGVVPELIIQKRRNGADAWYTFTVQNGFGLLNSTGAWGGTGNGSGTNTIWQATSSTVTLDSTSAPGFAASGSTNLIYLFATCPGVSKVGSYTGTGSTQTISCGFTGGARFVLIKRTDSTGDWWVWDTARGMVAGTDPRLAMNSTAAEINNNWVYTTTGGFQIVTSDATINASGGSYIYLAIA